MTQPLFIGASANASLRTASRDPPRAQAISSLDNIRQQSLIIDLLILSNTHRRDILKRKLSSLWKVQEIIRPNVRVCAASKQKCRARLTNEMQKDCNTFLVTYETSRFASPRQSHPASLAPISNLKLPNLLSQRVVG